MPRFISNQLTLFVRELTSYISNTQHFVEQLAKLTIDDDEAMVSFDIKSFFTSVPVEGAINISIEEKVCRDNWILLEMLRVCLTTTAFQFRQKHYELADGLAMGSPMSPAVANIFMGRL